MFLWGDEGMIIIVVENKSIHNGTLEAYMGSHIGIGIVGKMVYVSLVGDPHLSSFSGE